MADSTRENPAIISQRTFVGGVQDYLPYHMVRDTSAVRLENCEIHVHGTVRRRGGLREWFENTASSVDFPLLLKSFSGIRGLGPIEISVWNSAANTSQTTIDFGDGNPQTIAFPDSFAFDEKGDIFKLLDRVYYGRAGQNTLYWESGASALSQELATPGFSETTIPPVVTGVFFQGRGWAGGDPSAEDLVYFSGALGTDGDGESTRTPLSWDRHFQAFRMETGRVRAIIPFRNTALVVFTDKGIEVLEPNCCEILNTHRYTLHRNTGCPFRQTIQICGEDIFFMDQEGHIRSLKQTELDENQGVLNAPLSLTIQNVIDRQVKTRLDWARSAFSKGMYWIWMPTNGSQYANEGWGYSIRDQAWVGPYYFARDIDDDAHLVPTIVGGVDGNRFENDEERLYVLGKTVDDEIKTYIALEPEDYTDDGVIIPVVLETKNYTAGDPLKKTWFHTEQEVRFLIDPGDEDLDITVDVRGDEDGYVSTDAVTMSVSARPHLPVDLPFALVPEKRQQLKTSLAGIIGYPTNGLMERITIRDDNSRWEILTLVVSGIVEELDFQR